MSKLNIVALYLDTWRQDKNKAICLGTWFLVKMSTYQEAKSQTISLLKPTLCKRSFKHFEVFSSNLHLKELELLQLEVVWGWACRSESNGQKYPIPDTGFADSEEIN